MSKRLIPILLTVLLGPAVLAFDAMIPSGSTTKTVSFHAVQSGDHVSNFTGGTTFTVYYSIEGGTPTAMTTPTVTELDSSHMPGWYKVLIDEESMTVVPAGQDVATLDLHITHANMDPKAVKVGVAEPLATIQEVQTGLATAANQTTIIGYVDGVEAKTNLIPASPAATGDIPSASTVAAAVVDLSLTGHNTAGTVGKALTDAAAGGDPWTLTASGYDTGTFGDIVANTATIDDLNDVITANAIIARMDALEAKLTAMIQLDGADYEWTPAALEEAPTGTGSGLTAQQTRDAMKLAPSAGAAAAGSIDDWFSDLKVLIEQIISVLSVVVPQ